ncbi:uncharacterized protein LOC116251433 isoform X2 [Nymphaea colorata]|uniref:uncharacterized protein LOC116251433 isoform X2 n=1 Tax=Nymphaea colorata TaxID=210225 RepID=UPI00129E22C9|nr:uncharacterized protein LOC116251433 isoform X2 [Nymphaea colorata]
MALLPKPTAGATFLRATLLLSPTTQRLPSRLSFFASSRRRSDDSTSTARYRHGPHQWSGLDDWREAPINGLRVWGAKGPESSLSSSSSSFSLPPHRQTLESQSLSSLAEWGRLILSTSDPAAKAAYTHIAYTKWVSDELSLGAAEPPDCPARPEKPLLVSHKEIPSPKESGLPLNAYMLHNLAHVELNAIDLAWDTVVRLEELGFSYGDMFAHNLLWRECARTSGNVAARLAVIPLVQEARGLDAGPRLVKRLVGFGDNRTSSIVAKISEEEVAHVAVGMFWFLRVCEKLGRMPDISFKDILKEFNVELKGPFNHVARQEAGIPRDWYEEASLASEKNKSDLAEVYNRLECIISMEKENSVLSDSSNER